MITNEMLNINNIISLNMAANGGEERAILNRNLLESIFSSYHYYDTLPLQICSIFRSILLNHCFEDGNKRTAVLFLMEYCEVLNLTIGVDDNKLGDIVYFIIEHRSSVSDIANMIFTK